LDRSNRSPYLSNHFQPLFNDDRSARLHFTRSSHHSSKQPYFQQIGVLMVFFHPCSSHFSCAFSYVPGGIYGGSAFELGQGLMQ
jgi:hypothetical protein